eukprot:4720384-Amphidinium_carterae.1
MIQSPQRIHLRFLPDPPPDDASIFWNPFTRLAKLGTPVASFLSKEEQIYNQTLPPLGGMQKNVGLTQHRLAKSLSELVCVWLFNVGEHDSALTSCPWGHQTPTPAQAMLPNSGTQPRNLAL